MTSKTETVDLVDQRDRDRACRDLDSSLVVEAGAGTGKTTVLVCRVLHILESQRATLPEIVAITFTEKAAGELKIRLREEIEKRGLRDSLQQLDRTNVSTIHAFASALLRERPVEAGVDPGFEQLDALSGTLLEEELWEEWIGLQLESSHPVLKDALASGISIKHMREMAGKLYENRDVAEGLGAVQPGELVERVLHWLAGPASRQSPVASRQSFVSFAQQEKERRGQLDFQDLLIKARDMLRDNREARRYFQSKFKYILVDEFQDTDPLQVEIVFFLAEERPLADSWRSVQLKPGKLFVVGDPKQSIYRFRRADIEMYAQARRQICGQNEPLKIVQNFRSVPGVIDWINDAFSKLIVPSDYQPSYEPLAAARRLPAPSRPSDAPLPPRVLFPSDAKEQPASAPEYRVAEADLIAQVVLAALEDQWTITEKGGRVRPVRRRDIAILFGRWSNEIDIYEAALQAHGLAYHMDGGKNFFVRQEVRSLAACLSAVEDPMDAVALVAALRSSFFGFSDEDLFSVVSGGKKLNYLEDPGEEWPELREGFRLLRSLHEERNRKTISQTVDGLLDSTRALQALALQPYGDQAVANLLKVAEQARAFDRQRLTTFGRFARWISKMEDEQKDEAESALIEAEEDILRLFTIHRAKGLEFPVVILANLNFGKARADRLIVEHVGAKFHARIEVQSERGKTLRLATSDFINAVERERQREADELKRLFYVGATRARDYLVLPILQYQKKPVGFLQMLLESQTAVPSQISRRSGEPPPPLKIDLADQADYDPGILLERKQWEAERESTWERARGGIEWASATSQKAALWEELETEHWGTGDGTALGAAFHEIMDQIDWSDPTSLGQLCRDRAGFFGISARAALLEEMARWCLKSDLVGRALASQNYWKEMPFACFDPPRMMEGAMDLVFREPGGLVIVDFKTDATPKRLESVYRIQGETYARALAKITGQAPREVWFLFVQAKTAERLELGKGQMKLF